MERSDSDTSLQYQSGLQPVISPGCRVLIVGSFPSKISLIRGEYYANPRNDFWKIMEIVLTMPSGLHYADRIAFILTHSIGLWDVICRCIRPGSADGAIRDPTPSEIGSLLIRYPSIRYILCNGRRAESGIDATLLHGAGDISENLIDIRYLPSSSPAHAIKFAEKCAHWMIIRDLLVED